MIVVTVTYNIIINHNSKFPIKKRKKDKKGINTK